MAYAYKRSITIDHTKCGSTDSSNFPVLVSVTNTTLKSTGNGGHVQSSSGYDINFFSDSGLTTLLSWEIDQYDAVNGILIAWVNISTVSHSSDTVFYVGYGNSSILSFQGGATGAAWNANYQGVWHLPNGSTLTANDSTSNANNGTINGPTATTGYIDGGANFAGGTDELNMAHASGLAITGAATLSTWVNITTYNSPMVLIGKWGDNPYGFSILTIGTSLYAVIGTSGGTANITAIYTFPNTGVWHYVHAVYTPSTSVQLYIDGVNVVTNTSSIPSTMSDSSSHDFKMGRGTANAYPFIGKLDEGRILTIALSADWILTEYNNQFSPATFYTFGSETSLSIFSRNISIQQAINRSNTY
jgi:hypothetical protein